MTTVPPHNHGRRPGHVHEGGGEAGAEGVSRVKAVVLVAAAVLLGVVLLHVDKGSGKVAQSAGASTTPTTGARPADTTTTTTTPPTKPSAAVKVLVANGGTVNGAATIFTSKLSKLGWGTLAPTTTTSPASASAVYYASGQQGAAAAIASTLGLQPSVVQPLSSSVPVAGATAASVVLVVGPDLAPQVTAGTG